MVMNVLHYLIFSIDLVSVMVMVAGIVYALWQFLGGVCGLYAKITIDQARLTVGRSIVFAVELLLAADILRTMIAPDYYSMGLLACLVVIRSVLTFFLYIELKGL